MGSALIGFDWGKPVVVNDPDWGKPVFVDGSAVPTDVLGMFDIAVRQREMNGIKIVPVRIGRVLLKSGQEVINRARAVAGAKGLPGGKARDNVYYHLQWHQNALANASGPDAIYGSGDDLKKWVMQAFIEANAVEEGAAHIDAAWSQMWADIAQAMSELPVTVAKAVGKAGGGLIEGVTGLPVWAWVLIGIGTAGLLGFFIWALARTPAGVIATRNATRRYLW